MADPFDFSQTDPSAPGMLGQPVGFWQDLARFGGNLAASANARTPQGFLANGTGLAGPLGAAVTATMDQGRQSAVTRSGLAAQGATTRKTNIENQLLGYQLPTAKAAADLNLRFMNDPAAASQYLQQFNNANGAGPAGLAASESGGNPAAVNSAGYSGKFQFGAPRLAELGMYQPAAGENLNANSWGGTFSIPGFPDVKTRADFLGNQQAQNAAYSTHMQNINQAISATPGADRFDPAGLQAVAHLGGVAGMQRFVATGGQYNPADSNGTSLSDYYTRFSGHGAASPAAGPRTGPGPMVPGGRQQPAPASAPDPQMLAMSQQLTQQAGVLEQQQAFAKSMQARGVMVPIPPGDPAALRQQAGQYLTSALAGPTAAAQSNAKAPTTLQRVTPGGVLFDANGNVKGFAPVQSDEVLTSGPNKGLHGTVLRNPITNEVIGQPASGQSAEQGGMPSGMIPKALPPQEEGRLKAAGAVEGHDLEHDRKIVETDLAHVVDNTIQGKLQMLKLRTLIDPAATGFMGETRMALKNAIETLSPGFANAFDLNASPAQELKKIATMGAGKSEREDQGAKGGLRLMQIYMEANPNLENQPEANKHMANMILLAHQLHEDYATGANGFYQENRAGFVGPEHKTYNPISQYDQAFIQKMRPEMYKSATDALNGVPYVEWSKGLTGPQLQIVGGILQRADPNASVNIGGKMLPVSAFTKTIGPTDITNGR